MSFAIAAIYKGKQVFLVSDGQVTGRQGIADEDLDKTIRINQSVSIGITGTVTFLNQVIALLQQASSLNHCSAQEVESNLIQAAQAIDTVWRKMAPSKIPEAVFLIAGFNDNTPYISAVAVHNHDIQPIHNSVLAGSYQFIPAPPQDILADECIDVCSLYLSYGMWGSLSPKSHLEGLVEAIAARSQFVNTHTFSQEMLPLSQQH